MTHWWPRILCLLCVLAPGVAANAAPSDETASTETGETSFVVEVLAGSELRRVTVPGAAARPESGDPAVVEVLAGSELRRVPVRLETSTTTRDLQPEQDLGPKQAALEVRGAVIGSFAPPNRSAGQSLATGSGNQLARELDRMASVYTRVLGIPIDPQLRADMGVVDRAGAERVGRVGAVERRSSYRHPGRELPGGSQARQTALLDRTRHSSSHAILARLPDRPPAWLDEGLSELMEGLRTEPNVTRIEPRQELLQIAAAAEARGPRPSLSEVLAMGAEQLEADPVSRAWAWSLSFFLMSRPQTRSIVREMLRDVEPGSDAEALARYPGGRRELEQDWQLFRASPASERALLLHYSASEPLELQPRPTVPPIDVSARPLPATGVGSTAATADQDGSGRVEQRWRRLLRCVRATVGRNSDNRSEFCPPAPGSAR